MFEAVGLDSDYDATYAEPETDPRFADIPPTTWRELLHWGRVKSIEPGFPVYRLTGSGWVEGLTTAGLATSDPVRQRCIALTKALKDSVDRHSHSDSYVTLKELALASATSPGWCFNALQSRFLANSFPTKQMDVRIDYPMVYVPPTFGHSRVQMFNERTS